MPTAQHLTNAMAISVVVPTYNEAPNVVPLVKRIAKTMKRAHTKYEIIFIDDRSTDSTPDIIRALARTYPVRVYTKQGVKGKAYSLIEGFAKAKYTHICMIDGDLQYPPEAIPGMAALLGHEKADIVQTRRVDNSTSTLRKLSTRIFNFIFAQLLFGIKFDTQSGLKLFKKEVLSQVELDPGAWTFDLDFLVKTMRLGYKVVSYDITFSERLHGEAKINVFTAATAMAVDSVKLRVATSKFGRFQSAGKLQKATTRNTIMALVVVAATVAGMSMNASAASMPSLSIDTSEHTVPAIQSAPVSGSTALLKVQQDTPKAPDITLFSSTALAIPTAEAVGAAYHSVEPTSGSSIYSNHPQRQAVRLSSLFQRLGIAVIKMGVTVMLVGATLYVVTKIRIRTGKLAVQ